MAYQLTHAEFDQVLGALQQYYDIYAPVRLEGKGRCSDLDSIRYQKIESVGEIVYEEKSEFSAKEIAFPVNETLFYFNEEAMTENVKGYEKDVLVFLRSCDIQGFDRIDTIFLDNGQSLDNYYEKKRKHIKFIRMSCGEGFHNCFCFSMGTNETEDYVLGVDFKEDKVTIEVKDEAFGKAFEDYKAVDAQIAYVTANDVEVDLPPIEKLDIHKIFYHPMWDQYTRRCIACGRCNYVCPTCTCFNVLDMYYEDNGHIGERKRTWASCHVDGFTEMAGGHSFRRPNGERMRFKTMHKVYDYKKRFGKNMCIGCGRCDDVCPEYISYANAVNEVTKLVKEEE
ncbi:MAG: anaerobic sulfite reductase subunit AsrA [Cellulosilyticaceae bacterium]